MSNDPVETNPDLYRVVLENEHVRVLEYRDRPGDRTLRHAHPDSVMITLSAFRRRLHGAAGTSDVELEAGLVRWLPAQAHAGENIGNTPSSAIFVELKGAGAPRDSGELGPAEG